MHFAPKTFYEALQATVKLTPFHLCWQSFYVFFFEYFLNAFASLTFRHKKLWDFLFWSTWGSLIKTPLIRSLFSNWRNLFKTTFTATNRFHNQSQTDFNRARLPTTSSNFVPIIYKIEILPLINMSYCLAFWRKERYWQISGYY